jgi:hypothetical protein
MPGSNSFGNIVAYSEITGTGNYTNLKPVAGNISFSDFVPTGTIVTVVVTDGQKIERSRGVYSTSLNRITRVSVLLPLSGAVDWGAGKKYIFLDMSGSISFTDIIGIATVTQGGTGANLSATGGTSQIVRQNTVGGAFTVSQLGISELSGLATGIANFLATPSSANLISAITDETGTGALVFANTPTLVTPVLGAASGTSLSLASPGLIGGLSGVLNLTGSLGIAISRYVATVNGPQLKFGKSRGSIATAGAVAALDKLFEIVGYGDDGSTNGDITVESLLIRGSVEGSVSTGVVSGNISFHTMNSGGTFAERIRIHASGGLSVGSTVDPGATNLSVTGTITGASGSNLLDQIRPNYVTCTSQLDKTSNTTLATATGLTLSLVAAKTYTIKGWISVTSGAAGGLKLALIAAASLSATSCRFNARAMNGTTIVSNTTVTSLGSNLVATNAVITDVYIEGSIVVNAGGTINVQMAQNTSDATTSSVFAGSVFSAVRQN